MLRPLRTNHWRRFVSLAVRHAWISATVFVVVMTIGVLKIYRTVPVYQAVAKVLVERQSPRVMKFDDLMQAGPMWGDDYYKTQEGVVNSRAVMDLALSDPRLKEFLDLGTQSPPKSSLLGELRRTVRAVLYNPVSGPVEPWQRLRGYVYGEHMSDTQFLRIKAEHTDRSKAALIANAVSKAFVAYHIQRKHAITGDAYSFLRAQTEREEAALKISQRELTRFREDAENTSFDVASEGHPVFKRLARINEQLTETEISLIELTTQLTQLRSVLKLDDESWVADNEQIFSLHQVREDRALVSVRAELHEVEYRIAKLSGVYGPEHPQLRSASRELEHLRETLRNSLRENADSLTARVTVLQNQEKELKAEYAEQNSRSVGLVKESVQFATLQNDVAERRGAPSTAFGRAGSAHARSRAFW